MFSSVGETFAAVSAMMSKADGSAAEAVLAAPEAARLHRTYVQISRPRSKLRQWLRLSGARPPQRRVCPGPRPAHPRAARRHRAVQSTTPRSRVGRGRRALSSRLRTSLPRQLAREVPLPAGRHCFVRQQRWLQRRAGTQRISVRSCRSRVGNLRQQWALAGIAKHDQWLWMAGYSTFS